MPEPGEGLPQLVTGIDGVGEDVAQPGERMSDRGKRQQCAIAVLVCGPG